MMPMAATLANSRRRNQVWPTLVRIFGSSASARSCAAAEASSRPQPRQAVTRPAKTSGSAAGPPGLGYYSFDLGAWHAISLNSNIGYGQSSAQLQWLRADLGSNQARCTLAYWHHPRFTSGAHQGNNPWVGPFWNALYTARADVVLGGHEHNYERFARQDAAGRAKQGDRMLASPRLETGVRAFFDDMLRFDDLAVLAKDPGIYPTFGAETVGDAREQTLRTLVE